MGGFPEIPGKHLERRICAFDGLLAIASFVIQYRKEIVAMAYRSIQNAPKGLVFFLVELR